MHILASSSGVSGRGSKNLVNAFQTLAGAGNAQLEKFSNAFEQFSGIIFKKFSERPDPHSPLGCATDQALSAAAFLMAPRQCFGI